jgi:F0F1-type ATP synthase assembly protein I
MNINHYIKFTCWTSIVIIIWGLVADFIDSKPETWAALIFFLLMGLIAWSVSIERRAP